MRTEAKTGGDRLGTALRVAAWGGAAFLWLPPLAAM